jgi:hypothetical protein
MTDNIDTSFDVWNPKSIAAPLRIEAHDASMAASSWTVRFDEKDALKNGGEVVVLVRGVTSGTTTKWEVTKLCGYRALEVK